MVSLSEIYVKGSVSMNGLKRLQNYLCRESYDGAVLISPTNLHYFTGFTGTTGYALILHHQAFFITDGRYTEQAKQECQGYTVIQYEKNPWQAMNKALKSVMPKGHACLFEGNYVPVDTYEDFCNVLTFDGFKSYNFSNLRAIKTEEELVKMRQAAKIADDSFAALLPQLHPGMTENEARILLEKEMLMRGSDEPSFTTIIASGVRSCMPHGVASDKVIEEGDFVTFDFGAVYEGYHSDMTRTIVMGTASELQRKLYASVLKAQKKGVAAVHAGMTSKELDAVCRDSLTADGYGDKYTHGTGHGVGLEIHELPVASPRSTDTLEENMVVTVEPGIYFPEEIGLRIEDSVIVTREGCEVLTHTSKDLIELGK